jgi:hypothetical protein
VGHGLGHDFDIIFALHHQGGEESGENRVSYEREYEKIAGQGLLYGHQFLICHEKSSTYG